MRAIPTCEATSMPSVRVLFISVTLMLQLTANTNQNRANSVKTKTNNVQQKLELPETRELTPSIQLQLSSLPRNGCVPIQSLTLTEQVVTYPLTKFIRLLVVSSIE